VLSVRAQGDNLLKNRDASPEQVKPLSINEIRDPKLNYSFFPDMAVEIAGYVAGVVSGGVRETANCRRPDLRNVRILIVASPKEVKNPTKYVVLEITPRWQKNFGWDDSNFRLMLEKARTQLEGKWVTFRGWMFYNYGFIDEAQSTNPGVGDVWRATPWELHPVTSYKVLDGPPESVARGQNGDAILATGHRMRSPVYPFLYSEKISPVKIENNHATTSIIDECLGQCVDFYKDKCADCRSKPLKERRVCLRKANRVRDECRLACVER